MFLKATQVTPDKNIRHSIVIHNHTDVYDKDFWSAICKSSMQCVKVKIGQVVAVAKLRPMEHGDKHPHFHTLVNYLRIISYLQY
jgi:hypothetical protein